MSRTDEFVKLIRHSEVHNGVRMTEGLVVDPEEWTPDECEGGGIHFCRPQDLAKWYDLYEDLAWVRTVTVPDDAKFIEFENKAKASAVVLGPRRTIKEYVATWTQEQCRHALPLDSRLLCEMSAAQRTEELCLYAMRIDGEAVQHLTDQERTSDVCLAAVQDAGHAVQYLTSEQRTPTVCLAAVRENGRAIEYLSDEQRTPDVCLALVKSLPVYGVSYLTPEERTPAVCLTAVHHDGYALQFLTDEQRTPAVCQAALKQNPSAACHLTPDQLDSIGKKRTRTAVQPLRRSERVKRQRKYSSSHTVGL